MRQALRALLAVILLLLCSLPATAQQASTPPVAAPTQQPVGSPPQATTPTAVPADAATDAGGTPIISKATPIGLRDLSPWSMFLTAGLVVQSIMGGLAFASLVTWTTFIAKFFELMLAKRRLGNALYAAADTRSLDEALTALRRDKSVMRAFVGTAINEARLSADIDNEAGIKERAASSFSEITRSESRRIRMGMGVLATIGATAPFVGLFGTVWGIMNSFIGISKSQTTNLAVVAPGIAEALLATAIGLFAAIPAVVFYNHFSRVTKGYLELVNRASGAAGRQLSRDL
ncbi:MAG TPA: tonB-system energizer ExbB, partial [Candidatus Cybelea sp.]|nr:tonB-system energizer ExbB [Candidatus Cybelea sp.]